MCGGGGGEGTGKAWERDGRIIWKWCGGGGGGGGSREKGRGGGRVRKGLEGALLIIQPSARILSVRKRLPARPQLDWTPGSAT